LPSPPGSAPSLSFTSWICSWLSLSFSSWDELLIPLLLAWSWTSLGLHGVCYLFSDVLMVLWKNSGVLCVGSLLISNGSCLFWSCPSSRPAAHWVAVVVTAPQPCHGDYAACKQLLCLLSRLDLILSPGRDVHLLCTHLLCTPSDWYKNRCSLDQTHSMMQWQNCLP
jgi:hypothetical protein